VSDPALVVGKDVMATVRASAEAVVEAPPAVVFGCIGDYRERHRHFLPPAFTDFCVEEGGTGEGTVVRYTLGVGGRSRGYRMRVVVPEPGRVLEEHDTASSLVTRFTVTPEDAPGTGRSRVRIETTWEGAGGIGGFFEKRFAPAALRRLYEDELARLGAYAKEQASRL